MPPIVDSPNHRSFGCAGTGAGTTQTKGIAR